MKNKIGKFVPNGVKLEKHEYDTVIFLLDHGHNIELIPPSFTKGQHSADLLLDGIQWEMKSPSGKSDHTIECILKRAVKQSENIILDLRRIKIPPEKAIKLVSKQFSFRHSIKRIKVITKLGEVLDFYR